LRLPWSQNLSVPRRSFPSKYVEVAKTLDHEIASSSLGKKK